VSPLRPESWEHHSPPRSEVATLRAGLALSLCWGSVIIVAVVAVVAAFGTPSGGEAGAIAVAAALAVIGLVKRSRRWALWLSLAALALLVGMGMVSPDTRVDVLVMGTYTVIFFAVLLTSRPWGMAWIVLGVLVMVVVVSRSDLQVAVGGVTIPVGWVAVLQMVVAGSWLWWAWHAALDAAARRDAHAAEQEQVIAEATALQERTRAWREAITRTHETILNDLRYVLRSPEIDLGRLREQLLTTRDRRAQPPDADHIPGSGLGARLARDFAGRLEVRDLTGGEGAEWIDQVETVLVEIVRNISRHTDATTIAITLERVDRVHRITVTDDASTPSAPSAPPGIGRRFVVEEALEALGAQLQEASHATVITLPRTRRITSPAGRVLPLLLSVGFAGSALGGSPQFLLLLVGASLTYLPVTIAACLLTALSVVTVLRRRPASTPVVVVGSMLAAVVTWGLVIAQPTCAASALVLTTINLSINALFAILLWARPGRIWLLVLPALVGVLASDVLPGVTCSIQSADVLLSSAVLMPILILLSRLSSRSTARWEQQDRQRWEAEITEIARAEADVDLARALGNSIDRAWAQMWEVAEGAPLDEAGRRRLRTVESAIRASLQVDPRYAGAFVLAARHVVAAAGVVGVPVHVRALRSSTDPRPLDPEIIRLLTQLVTVYPDAAASIHAFTDGHDDYLSVTTTSEAAAWVGIGPDWTLELEDGQVGGAEIDYVGDERGPEARVSILVWRTSCVAVPEPAVVG
jgi:hypothetical protein